MAWKKGRWILGGIGIVIFSLILSGCATGIYKTKADYSVTEQVTMSFLGAYFQGDVDKALEYVAEECILTTDSGDLKGKAAIAQLIKANTEKNNTMEIAETSKIDNSKVMLIINNTIPLFQLAGVDIIKTREKFEVQDGKIVKWEIKYLKESVDHIEQVASGSTGLEVEVKDGQIIVGNVQRKSPAEDQGIKKGDIIRTINGVSLQEMKYGAEEIPYRLIGEIGTRVGLELSRGSETISVKLMRVHVKDFR